MPCSWWRCSLTAFVACSVPQEVSALLSSRISAQDEEDVQAELAALQAEQVRLALPRLLRAEPTARSVSMELVASETHKHSLLQTGTKLPEAPTHALPEVERPAVSVPAEAETRPGERQSERRQAIAA